MRTISIVLVALCVSCGDDPPGETCGVPAGTLDGAATVTVTVQPQSTQVVAWVWGRNNDCNQTGSGVVSVTLRGEQSDDSQFGMGFCLPRPDQVVESTALDLANTNVVHLVGASSSSGGCTTQLAPDARPTGQISFAGFCDTSSESFLVTLDGTVPGIQTCGSAASTSVTMKLGGQFVVDPQ